MADAPKKITLPIPQTPVDVVNWTALAIERRKEYQAMFILKNELDDIKLRLFNAEIP